MAASNTIAMMVIAVLAVTTVAGFSTCGSISSIGAYAKSWNAEFCADSMTRGCYELDVGPLNLLKLPSEARAKDTFMMNPKAGLNKWAACEKTNAETITETELSTTYCGDDAVEKVKTCHMGKSHVMMYYYTGECRTLGINICDSMFTVPKDCIESTSDGMAMASTLNDQLFDMAQQIPVTWQYVTCMQYGDIQYYIKQEMRNTGPPPVQMISDYVWIYDLEEPCVEGDPATADFKGQGRTGDVVVSDRILSDEMKEAFGMDWDYF